MYFIEPAVILSVTLMANGDLVVIERPQSNPLQPLAYCVNTSSTDGTCSHAPLPIKKIYRAQEGKIVLYKEVQQVPVTKTKEVIEMEFPE